MKVLITLLVFVLTGCAGSESNLVIHVAIVQFCEDDSPRTIIGNTSEEVISRIRKEAEDSNGNYRMLGKQQHWARVKDGRIEWPGVMK